MLVSTFISSRLGFCNLLFFAGLPKYTLNKLYPIQNVAARVLTKPQRPEQITPILSSLHRLPVRQRINFEVLLIVFKCFNGLASPYICDTLADYTPETSLRSSDKGLVTVPRIHSNSAHGASTHYSPVLWNSLPQESQLEQCIFLKCKPKAYLS